MVVRSPEVDPTDAIGVAGSIISIPLVLLGSLPASRLMVIQTEGTAASFTAEFSSDATVSDRSKRIAYFTGGTAAAPIDFLGTYSREDGNIYCKIVPDAGEDNKYQVRVFIDEGE